ncbi:MAG: 30S ribosomal protein S16 [bacterium]|nr:30S ribosomal protein S16 [bacterium]
MLAIKLAKTGKTNKKMFRVIISEKSRDPYGNILEILGSYNPHSKELIVKAERVKYWLTKGAQMTATINNLLIEKKIIEGKKATASKVKKTSEKRLAQLKTKTDKKTVRESAPAETPAETPVESAPVAKNPVAETLVEVAPAETPVEDIPIKDTPTKEAPKKKAKTE